MMRIPLVTIWSTHVLQCLYEVYSGATLFLLRLYEQTELQHDNSCYHSQQDALKAQMRSQYE